MTNIYVGNSAALVSAAKSAASGDTILLAPGTYDGVLLKNIVKSGHINITSYDPAHEAKLSDLEIINSSGLSFNHVEFTTGSDPYFGTRILSSKLISLNDVHVHGSLDNNPQDDVNGIQVQNSAGINITNSNFEQLYNALYNSNSSNINIMNNSFHDIRCDGIDNGGSSEVNIYRNTFTDFDPEGVGGANDHPDAIQFWTTNTTSSASNISVHNNLITRGDGSYIQGIFITDPSGHLPFQNVSVNGNYVIGELYQGIDVQGASNLSLTGNIVSAYSDIQSWIRVDGIRSGAVAYNHSTSYLLNPPSTYSTVSNAATTITTDGGVAALKNWFIGMSASPASLSDSMIQELGSKALVHEYGTAGNDTITLAAGFTSATGGVGNDTFVVGPVASGTYHAVITDFDAYGNHDVLDISSFVRAGYAPRVSELGGNALIWFGTASGITLENVQASALKFSSNGFFVM